MRELFSLQRLVILLTDNDTAKSWRITTLWYLSSLIRYCNITKPQKTHRLQFYYLIW
jgi:hypothetical protein